MTTLTLHVNGMTCDHCARTAEQALNALPGVKARISYQDASAHVETTGETDTDKLLKAVESKGYSASLAEDGEAQ